MEYLEKVNSATKYPSILTYHEMGEKGRLVEDKMVPFTGDVIVTEKVDGTNARIVIDSTGDWVIGEREGLLTAKGDRVWNPSLGIVGALYTAAGDIASTPYARPESGLRAFYLEVYGGKVGANAKQYTGGGNVGYRLFDVADIPEKVLGWSREDISLWRQHGGQEFLPETRLTSMATACALPLTPRLATVRLSSLPMSLAGAWKFLCDHLENGTEVALDDGAKGSPEGVVIRTVDRSAIAKVRFADYRRTLKIK